MALGIRRVSLPEDRDEMIHVLYRNFGTNQEPRFNWRHSLNPAGEAWSWFMYDKDSLSTVAMATVFPRHMRVNGQRLRAGQVGEFAVDAKYRSLGPAVKLQRATFDPVTAGEISFCYDCPPHDEGMSTFVRIGMRPNCEVHRYALLLRSNEYLAKRLGTGTWTKPLIAAANLLLSTRKVSRSRVTAEISEHQQDFGEEFSELDKSVASVGVIRASRHAEDLNWRYVDDPMASTLLPKGVAGKYRVLVARQKGELKAFLVFLIQSDQIACVVDLFGHNLGKFGACLIDAAVDICDREQVSGLHAYSADGEMQLVLERSGFTRRERNARVVAYTNPGDSGLGEVMHRGRWAFTQLEVML